LAHDYISHLEELKQVLKQKKSVEENKLSND
jgi:hypothetical protein